MHVVNVRPSIIPFMRPVDIAEQYLHYLPFIGAQVELQSLPARVPGYRIATGRIPQRIPKLANQTAVDLHLKKVHGIQIVTENLVYQRKRGADCLWHLERLLYPGFSHWYSTLTSVVGTTQDSITLASLTLDRLLEFAPVLPTLEFAVKGTIAESRRFRCRCDRVHKGMFSVTVAQPGTRCFLGREN